MTTKRCLILVALVLFALPAWAETESDIGWAGWGLRVGLAALAAGQLGRGLQRVQCPPRIPVGRYRQPLQSLLFDLQARFGQPALLAERPPANLGEILRAQGFEDEHARAAEQRPDNLEAGVLRRGPNEDDRPRFHVGKESVPAWLE